jgi:S1-C subfamily serine protease
MMQAMDPNRPEWTRELARVPKRVVLAMLLGVVAAACAAGLAYASTRAAPIGNGVVVIDTNLAYEGGQAAGTGMVLTSSGEILTNNHVIRGATTIRIVLPGTGRRYTAKVVGYDVTADVAVLQASGASNLKTVSLGNSSTLKVGQSVTAVGNARGTGSLTSASGRVTGLSRAITVNDDQGGSEHLSGLIETNAGLQPGDSGGPLTSGGKVVGMDTAASLGYGYQQVVSNDGYAIPINRAIAIATQITSGKASSTVHVGGTAFLGVQVSSDAYGGSGAVIESVVPGGPADRAGLQPGDVITQFAGHTVASPSALTSIVLREKPGVHVSVTYVDQTEATGTASVTLGSGPAQ